MKKLLTILAVAGLILLGSNPAGAVKFWGVGNPAVSPGAEPSPVIFKFDTVAQSLTGPIFGFDTLGWKQIEGIADSGKYLYVSHNTYAEAGDFKIAKVSRSTGAAITSTSVFGFMGQPSSRVNALRFYNGNLYGVESSPGSSWSNYAVKITLDANGDVSGVTKGAYVGPTPDGALSYDSVTNLWYATSPAAPSGSLFYTTSDIMLTDATKSGGDSAIQNIGTISGWEFDVAGNLFGVSLSATEVYSINLGTRQAASLFNLSADLPGINSFSGLSNIFPDTTAPVVTVPANMTVASAIPVRVTFFASAVDNIDGTLTPSCSPASRSIFQLGLTTVTCSATDSSGNTGSSSFTILVGVPSAPTGIWAEAGDASAKVYFSAPWNDGGALITSYTATSTPGGIMASGAGSPITVPGLDNGTPYSFTVRATNGAGRTSPESSPSNTVTPTALVPAAPSGVWVQAGDGSVTINFLAPWNAGSVSDITGYVFTLYPGGATTTRSGSSTLPFTWTGLANNTAYTFTVRATNSRGTGPESSASNSVTPLEWAPNIPAGIWAKAGDTNASVNFSTPWTPPGTTLTSYTVTINPGGATRTFTPSGLPTEQYLWTGLSNGTAYTFTAKATNSLGRSSADSPSSNSVTPMELAPVTPAGIWAKAGEASATVYFSTPWTPAGTTIQSYTLTISTGGSVTITPSGAPTEQYLWTGLANGTAYTFTVQALNSTGRTSPVSPSSNSVTPAELVPSEPTGVWASAGDTKATVTFNPPWNNGGATITSYTVTSSPGGLTASGTGSPLTVAGLANGTAYTFTVRALNSAGRTSPESSPSNSVTPTALIPAAPANIFATAGDTTVTLTFSAPWNAHLVPAITGYTFTRTPDGSTITRWNSSTDPFIWTGLTNGTAYTFTVRAINSRGTGPETLPSNSVTPSVPTLIPAKPAGVTAEAGDLGATVRFTAPWTPEGTTITSYTVTSSPGGITASGTASPIVVTGLTNGTAYTFTVKALNSAGFTSPDSDPSNSVTPAVIKPTIPAGIWAQAGDGKATVRFSASWTPAGTTITSYTLTINPGGTTQTITPSGSTTEQEQYIWTGLTNGVTYTFTVMATNSLGRQSDVSPSSLGVTPRPPTPTRPGGISAKAGDTIATVIFSKPWTPEGTTITSYTLEVLTAGSAYTITLTPASPVNETTETYTITGLTNGQAYTFHVKATNSAGATSTYSVLSETVTPTDQE